MESLTTQLLHVPTLKSRNFQESVDSPAMVFAHGKEGRGIRGGPCSR